MKPKTAGKSMHMPATLPSDTSRHPPAGPGSTPGPIPKPSYPCEICRSEYSWPAEDLFWSVPRNGWLCRECWNPEHGEPAISLQSEIDRQAASAPGPGMVRWSRNEPACVGWWWHYSHHSHDVRPLLVTTTPHTKSGVPKLVLAMHAGCLFEHYPGQWAGPLALPPPPGGPPVADAEQRMSLVDIWRDAQSEIYGEGKERTVQLGEVYARHFLQWFNQWTPPVGLGSIRDFDLHSAVGTFERWLLEPLDPTTPP